MTDQEIIELLNRTGHLHFPFGKKRGPYHLENLVPVSPCVERAIASYQDFMAQHLEPLCTHHHLRPAHADGDIGPATRELFELPRCGCCDYGEKVQPAVGTGSWKKCHDIGDFHAATVYINELGIPSFLEPHFDEVWDRAVTAYEALGLRFIRVDHLNANIDFSFVSRSNGWIGLAVVGQGESCGSEIWCKYLSTYKPANVVREWSTLVMHELGHNASLQHTRGGVMSPSIVNGLPASWEGDPSESILKRYYGGEPISPPPPPPPPDDDGYGTMQLTIGGKLRKFDVLPRAEVPG